MITIALAVDEDVRWSVIVPTSEETEVSLVRLRIRTEYVGDKETHMLVSEVVDNLADRFDQVQSYDLRKGVYLVTTTQSLRYEDIKQIRVYVHGGKDPWPPPPPPAPQGTDLAKFKDTYENGLSQLSIKASSAPSRWIEVKARPLPVVVPAGDKRG